MKKRLSVLTVMTLILILAMSIPVFADEISQGFKYELISGGAEVRIKGYDAPVTGPLRIPGELAGKPVTEIGSWAFEKCSGFTELEIPDTVRIIGQYAFHGCNGFKGTLHIPDSVTTIGSFTFWDCTGFSGLQLGDNISSIGSSAFSSCTGLKGKVTIPDSVTELDALAFDNCCGIEELELGNGLSNISHDTFRNCTGLTGTITIPDSITIVNYGAFLDCRGISEVVIGSNTNTIGSSAFSGCTGLESLTLGEKVNRINDWAFSECGKLGGTLVIPESVNTMGVGVFNKNYNVSCIRNESDVEMPADWFLKDKDDYFVDDDGNVIKRDDNIGRGTYSRNIPVEGVKIRPSKVTISVGETVELEAVIEPEDAPNRNVSWSSSDDRIAEVSDEGVVTGIKAGSAKITVTTEDGNKEARCTVKVVDMNPETPSIKSLTNTAKGLKLKWTGSENATGYEVYCKADNEKYKKVAVTSGTTYTHKDNLKNGSKYSYKVKAYREDDDNTYHSGYSSVKTICRLTQPAIKSLKNVKPASASVKWSKNSKGSGYQVQYSTKRNFGGAKKLNIGKARTTSKKIKNLSKKKTYYVRVRSYKKVGRTSYYSAWSEAKKVIISK